MTISDQPSFLTLTTRGQSELHNTVPSDTSLEAYVRLVQSESDLYKAWSALTRVSKIFKIQYRNDFSDQSNLKLNEGEITLFFVGPTSSENLLLINKGTPEQPEKLITVDYALYASYGLFNNIIVLKRNEEAELALRKWAAHNSYCYETWHLKEGELIGFDYRWAGIEAGLPPNLLTKLQNTKRIIEHPSDSDDLRVQISEFCSLVCSVYSRILCIWPEQTATKVSHERRRTNNLSSSLRAQIESLIDFMEHQAQACHQGIIEKDLIRHHLFSINAALSRFSSQLFSGMSPIASTECHFWCHSLLGVGTAILAVHGLKHSIERVFHEFRPYDRFCLLKEIRAEEDFEVRHLTAKYYSSSSVGKEEIRQVAQIGFETHNTLGDYYFQDLLPTVKLSSALTSQLVYFSGRDNFSQTNKTLSFPINAIEYCNSPKYSLLTATHELSHTIVNPILQDLLPNIRRPEAQDAAYRLATSKLEPKSVFDVARKIFLKSLIHYAGTRRPIEVEDQNGEPVITKISFLTICRDHAKEVREFMAHTYDFQCFFGGNPSMYVQSIWHSWSTSNNLNVNLHDYTLRTVVALASRMPLKEIKSQLPNLLGNVRQAVVTEISAYLSVIEDKIVRRAQELTSIIEKLLLSEEINGALRQSWQRGDSSQNSLGQEMLVPHKYLESYHASSGSSLSTDPAKSILLLTKLAYNYNAQSLSDLKQNHGSEAEQA